MVSITRIHVGRRTPSPIFQLNSQTKNSKMNLEGIRHFEQKLAFEIDPSDLYDELQQHANIMVIDARRPEAFERERIPGSINIPHRTMDRQSTAHLDPSLTYVVYCDGVGCNASTKGSFNLAKLGFKVKELMGGLEYWKVDGFPTEGFLHAPVKATHCAC